MFSHQLPPVVNPPANAKINLVVPFMLHQLFHPSKPCAALIAMESQFAGVFEHMLCQLPLFYEAFAATFAAEQETFLVVHSSTMPFHVRRVGERFVAL